ncbi:hypothetical protein [Mycoplasma bradburyae]|uniref:Inhibitor of apoptosis-promoting Bax1 n=1 Tax=Mycoplasma bradburyae TaxID=2963128 RepID=A0AAW6HQD3_9MOLU|nr:hypothetical protein [Mycoplasma bradburyae]MDC4182131.1 hypothetical protein [Mycoplasma bradburyae]MDC4182896.1 hypothetical protein [Mycoplasma bradburyae]MDC4183579.1 hypothetical protein [Mycoplasma bradburyae]MDC4184317.1 hypothetical protein [Mycoplasma bradburyae]UTS70300.1 hypothetical protein NMG68_00945 [Mycoplasma bradburyae]
MIAAQNYVKTILQTQNKLAKKAFLKSHIYAGIVFLASFIFALVITIIYKNVWSKSIQSTNALFISSSISLSVGFLIVIFSSFFVDINRSKTRIITFFVLVWLFLSYGLGGLLSSVDAANSLGIDENIKLSTFIVPLLIVSVVYISTSILGYYMSNKVGFSLAKLLFAMLIINIIFILGINIVYIFGFNAFKFDWIFLIISIVSLVISVISLVVSSFITKNTAEMIQLSGNEGLIQNFIIYNAYMLFIRLFSLFIDILRLFAYFRS